MSPIYFIDKVISHYCIKYKLYDCIICILNNTFKKHKVKVRKPINSLPFRAQRVRDKSK